MRSTLRWSYTCIYLKIPNRNEINFMGHNYRMFTDWYFATNIIIVFKSD